MFSSPAKILIILLALLQLVAPLVHAHTGEELSKQSIHLPGLEHYLVDNNTLDFHTIAHPCEHQGSVISVGTGIQQKKTASNNPLSAYLATALYSAPIAVQHLLLQLPSLHSPLIPTAPYTLLPPRAPPV